MLMRVEQLEVTSSRSLVEISAVKASIRVAWSVDDGLKVHLFFMGCVRTLAHGALVAFQMEVRVVARKFVLKFRRVDFDFVLELMVRALIVSRHRFFLSFI